MKFPGKRKTKHYFPVTESGRISFESNITENSNVYIVGIDQLIVDIEAKVDFDFLDRYGIKKGESVVLKDEIIEEI